MGYLKHPARTMTNIRERAIPTAEMNLSIVRLIRLIAAVIRSLNANNVEKDSARNLRAQKTRSAELPLHRER